MTAATDAPERLVEQARSLVAERRFAQAIECLNRALGGHPDRLDWAEYRGDVLQIVSRHEEALEDYRRALDRSPADAQRWPKIAHSLRSLGRLEEAEQAFMEALRLAPDSAESMANLGNLHRDAGRPRKAVVWLSRALAAVPGDHNVQAMLGAALLAADEPAQARPVLKQAFQGNPYDRTILSYLYVALCRTGDERSALGLTMPDHLIRSFQRPGSAGDAGPGDDLDERVAEHVRQHPTLEYERYGNTTRGGAHTGNLLETAPGPVAELFGWIEDQVRRYLRELPQAQNHPFLAWQPTAWDVDLWGIVIRSGGFQLSHIHRDGWVSGVYYAVVPDSVQGDAAEDTGGCLELGRPPEPICGTTDFPVRTIRPRPGRLNLFPSYVWHRTLPYEEEAERICVAFDIRPQV